MDQQNINFATVLWQNKYTKVNGCNSASSPPIPLIFKLETRYITQFLQQNIWGAPPKITLHFLDFSKKSTTQKTRFFRVGRNFGYRFLKKAPKTSIFGVPDPENFFPQNFDKKTSTHQKFRSGAPSSVFYALFTKKHFWDFSLKWIRF